MVSPPELECRIRRPCRTVERAPFDLTPLDQGINVDIDTLGPHAAECQLNESLLSSAEPVLVRLLQLVWIRR